MKHKFVSRTVILSVLLTLVFSAVVAPARASGLITHDEVVGMALEEINETAYPELYNLVRDYRDIVNYGATYPDWGYAAEYITKNAIYKDYSEKAHQRVFRVALANRLASAFPPASEDDRKSIAFWLGLISHQAQDNRWHDLNDNAQAFESVAAYQDARLAYDVEFGADKFVIIDGHNYGSIMHEYPMQTVVDVYRLDFGINVTIVDVQLGNVYQTLQIDAETISAYTTYFATRDELPWTYANLWNYHMGGLYDGAGYTAAAWQWAWESFDNGGVIYVKPDATGTGSCGSWANACTLQTALTLAHALGGGDIWVMEGTYKPTTGTDRTATFKLKRDIAVYGGFAGTETARDERDPAANLAILSGDIGIPDDNSDNSYHVVTVSKFAKEDLATLDGFTITGGNADGTSYNDDRGGGMFNTGNRAKNEPSSPIISNVTFSGNSADWYGGGLYNDFGSPTLTNVAFSGNSAGYHGGGMFNKSSSPQITEVTFNGNSAHWYGGGMYNESSSPTLTDVTFSGNSADYGGGMDDYQSNPTLTNVTFSGNSARIGGGMQNNLSNPTLTNVAFSGNSADYGGGMSNYQSNPTLTNVTFSGNSAENNGGGMDNSHSSPTLTNVTFGGNSANVYGGGMINQNSSNPQIRNTILWGNAATNSGAQIYNSSSAPVVSDSVVQGGYAGGTAIITADPVLGTPGNYGGSTQTIPLLPGSSAINTGNASFCTTGFDQRYVAYVGACDMGAFESRGFWLTKTGGDGQDAVVTTDFALPLGVTVTANDPDEPVDGGKVTFTAPGSGASAVITGSPAIIASGAASVTATANETVGSYNATAGAASATSVEFALTNDAPLHPILYVKLGGATDGACDTWANACELPYALSISIYSQEIWVAAGTHKPTDVTTDRAATFQLKRDVTVYGGFPDTGDPVFADRDPVTNVTILSGDIDSNDSQTPIITDIAAVSGNTTNSYHVVSGATGARLDGFIITAGCANGTDLNGYGGGMYNTDKSSLALANITFSGNQAVYGGGMYNLRSDPTVANATFTGNKATANGGGMVNDASAATVSSSVFDGNTALEGGGMYNLHSDPTVANATFTGNKATGNGGGMYNSYSNPMVANVTFNSNSATSWGGGMYNHLSNPTFANVTFSSNSARYGGGMYNSYSSPTLTNVTLSGNLASLDGGGMSNASSNPQMRNTILWGNTAPDGAQIHSYFSSPVVSDSVVQGGYAGGTAIITADPLLGTPGNYGGSTQTIPLLPGSSAMDAGNDTVCAAVAGAPDYGAGGLDQRGVARPKGSHCDIGAVEMDPATFHTISGNADVAEVTLSYAQTSTTSYAGGDYSFSVYDGWSGTVTPSRAGYTFSPSSRPYSSVIDDYSDENYIATNIEYTLTVTSAHGTVTKEPDQATYHYGDGVQLTVVPATGWGFVNWTGDLIGSANPVSITIQNTMSVTANCARVVGILYAKPGAAGTGDCFSWENACPLNAALELSVSGDEIWVMQGVHKPTTSATDRSATFQLKSGVAVYGGFAGTETARGDRNPATNVTILSGDIDNNDSQTPIITTIKTVTGNSANSYAVVTGATGATLDGFTVTAGYTTGRGGGMSNNSSSPTVTNVTFSGNHAGDGGGMYNTSSSPTLTDVAFNSNSAYSGGGMYSSLGSPTLTNVAFSGNSATDGGGMSNLASSPTLTNVTFSGNSATDGGGMYNYQCSPTLTGVTFNSNSATSWGGGMHNASSSPTLANVTFSGNSAPYGGGMANYNSSPTLTNVTFSANSADTNGGGMFNSSSNPQMRNTILWGNTAPDGAQIYNHSSSPVVSDSVVQGGYAGGTSIITADPLLGTPGNYGGSTQTIPLLPGSSAMDAGNDTVCAAVAGAPDYGAGGLDQRGVARPKGSHCDIGAVEMDPATFHTISGNAGLADVTLRYAQTFTTSYAGGDYSFFVYDGWSGTVTPSKEGYAFSPSSRPYSSVTIDYSDENYIPSIATEYTLTITSAHGTVIKSPDQPTYRYGDGVQLTVVPEAGWSFTNWTGDLTGGANPISITIQNNTSVTANYTFLANILYAKPDAAGAGNCLNWANACTLQTALTGASSGDMIWVAAGVHKPTTNPTGRAATFQLKSGVAVYGGFPDTGDATLADRDPAANVTILSGDIDNNDSQTPIITDTQTVTGNTTNSYAVVKGENNVTLDGFTITAGYTTGSGGGMYNNSRSPMVTNVTFSGNYAGDGGGMYNGSSNPILTNVTFSGNTAEFGGGMYNDASNPTLMNVTFSDNSAAYSGGGMYSNPGNPTLTNVTFSDNSAAYSGGGMVNLSYSSPTLTNVTFSGNSALNGHGGGMDNDNYASATLVNVTFSGNSATSDGSGMYNYRSDLTLTNVTFSANSAGSDGGGMYNYYGNISLTDVTFNGNSAGSGGGMFNSYSSPTLTNITFSGNMATGAGGGIANANSNPTITDTIFINNSATSSGGGMSNAGSNPRLTNVTFSGNSADSGGGMIIAYGGSTLTNVTFSGNSADWGGGIYNSDNGSNLIIANVTISGNSANYGGGMFSSSSSPQIRNTIFWGNTATYGPQIERSAGVPVVSDSVVQGGYAGGTNIVTADPLLGALGNYGGSTQTIPLQAGSSAIDAGNDTICQAAVGAPNYGAGGLDQRGVARPQGAHCDIGAYEVNVYTLTITSEHGTVTKNPDKVAYHDGEIVELTVSPAAGWSFLDWSGDLTGTAQPGFVTVHGNTSVSANYQREYTLTVNSAHGTVTKSPNRPTYHTGDVVTLTVTPEAGWTFIGWTPSLADNRVTIAGDTTVTANYTQDEYTLTVNSAHGAVTKSPNRPTYHYGDVVTLTVTPEAGWTFTGWTPFLADSQVTITGDTTVTANYTQDEHALTVNSAHGAVTKSLNRPTYHYGDVVTLSVTTEAGWTFTGWTPSLADNQVTITGDTTITANYTLDEYTLTVNSAHGAVTKDPDQPTYHYGDVVTLTATTETGWTFTGWTPSLAGNQVTITGDTTITANYTQDEHTLTVNPAHGTVTKEPDQPTYHYGDVVTLTVTPEAGWTFIGWTPFLADSQVTIAGDTTITANYTQNEYALIVNSAHGTVTKEPDQATYHYGDVVTLTVTSEPGWTFTDWTPSLTDNRVTITGDATIAANYTQNEYSLTVNSDHGTVTRDPDQPTYHYGDVVTLTVTSEAGWTFSGWTPSLIGNKARITGDTTVTANYTQNEYTLTVNSAHGTVTKEPDQATYHYGDVVTLSVTSEPGWTLSGWSPSLTGNQVTITGDTIIAANYTQDEYTLTVNSAHGAVTKSPDQPTYHYGDVVTLTITTEAGWTFTGWTPSLTANQVTITGDTTVTANYTQDEYTLTVNSAHGTATKDPSQVTYHYGDVVTLSVTPEAGWTFIGWTPSLADNQVTITGDTTVTANYTQDEYTLTITSGHGVVTKSPDQTTYHYGDVVTLSVTPEVGWTFTGWTPSLADNQVTITGDTTVTANYTQGEHTLTVNSAHGAVTKDPDQPTYHYGDVVTLSVTPEAGWTFTGWTPSLADNQVTITGDTTVTANYTQGEYTLIVNSDHGTVTKDPDQATYHYGDVVTVTASADPLWSFAGWSGDIVSSQNPLVFVVQGDLQLTARFGTYRVNLPLVIR